MMLLDLPTELLDCCLKPLGGEMLLVAPTCTVLRDRVNLIKAETLTELNATLPFPAAGYMGPGQACMVTNVWAFNQTATINTMFHSGSHGDKVFIRVASPCAHAIGEYSTFTFMSDFCAGGYIQFEVQLQSCANHPFCLTLAGGAILRLQPEAHAVWAYGHIDQAPSNVRADSTWHRITQIRVANGVETYENGKYIMWSSARVEDAEKVTLDLHRLDASGGITVTIRNARYSLCPFAA